MSDNTAAKPSRESTEAQPSQRPTTVAFDSKNIRRKADTEYFTRVTGARARKRKELARLKQEQAAKRKKEAETAREAEAAKRAALKQEQDTKRRAAALKRKEAARERRAAFRKTRKFKLLIALCVIIAIAAGAGIAWVVIQRGNKGSDGSAAENFNTAMKNASTDKERTEAIQEYYAQVVGDYNGEDAQEYERICAELRDTIEKTDNEYNKFFISIKLALFVSRYGDKQSEAKQLLDSVSDLAENDADKIKLYAAYIEIFDAMEKPEKAEYYQQLLDEIQTEAI